MLPSVSEVSGPVGGITRYFGWRELVILTEPGEEVDAVITKALDSIGGETKVAFHRQFIPQDQTTVDNIFRTLADWDMKVIFLHCRSSHVEAIFGAAENTGLLSADRVWIVTEPVVETCSSGMSKCPAGLIGIRLRRSHTDGAVDLRRDLVHDSVLVFAEALRSFRKNSGLPSRPLLLSDGRDLVPNEK